MRTERSRNKRAVAAAVWRLMLEFSMGHRGRIFGILHKLGLTFGDLRALLVLDPDEPRPMGSFAQAWGCDASNVTWMVDRLEERGLVERRMLATDRRVKTVVLTPLGVKTKAELLERLYEPPDALLALDRASLESVRHALTKLPSSAPAEFSVSPGEAVVARRGSA